MPWSVVYEKKTSVLEPRRNAEKEVGRKREPGCHSSVGPTTYQPKINGQRQLAARHGFSKASSSVLDNVVSSL